MPFTRANAESLLVAKLGGKLLFVRKSIARDGTNPDLAFPMANAMATLGLNVVDYASITDGDLAAIPAVRLTTFLGLSELYALEDIWGCMTDVTETIGGGNSRTQAWSSMSAEIAARIAALENLYKTYLVGIKPLQAGTVQLPFVTRGGPEF